MEGKKKLLIISDTPMWLEPSGSVAAFEPTLREVEHLTSLFEEITWIGFNRANYVFGNGRTSNTPLINFRLLASTGGDSLFSKVKSILYLPYYFFIIARAFRKYTYIHTRGPSVPALLGILLSFLYPRKKYWHKYAGNWNNAQAPFLYRMQKKLLRKATFSRVTLNGKWPDQLPHTLSFENPCITTAELQDAHLRADAKQFKAPYTICFAGRLEEAKGVGNLLSAFANLPSQYIGKLILAGDGKLRKHYEQMAMGIAFPVEFAGALERTQLNNVYGNSHFIILPSASEGFPKVLAEAMAYGCIPIVTNISALEQYIAHGVNGFLLPDNSAPTISSMMELVLVKEELKNISQRALQLAKRFTFDEFMTRIRNDVFFN